MSIMIPAFFGGSAGAALLLMRLATALMILFTLSKSFSPGFWLYLAAALLAAGLAAGFAVRLVAAVAALIIVGAAIRSGGTLGILLAVQALQSAALALLGAGAYSIDARLFGRRVIRLND
jgi:hypothetical protein